ncbi:MAG: NAD(P)H-hydrate dehydratase [Alphaproteobacteria bacterium]|nr:NAD(P)H-hydrate dehydratase [Alphaproteobacteria bacterium]
MAETDRRTIAAGIKGERLMEAAGEGIARLIMERFAPAPVAVLCGPGNNGGDGFVIARHLVRAGWRVRLASLAPVSKLSGDAGINARRWSRLHGRQATVPLTPAILDGAGLVVDALFGAGLVRPLGGVAGNVVAELNRRGLPVVAVDVPSGLDADTGAVAGEAGGGVAARAAFTVTFFRKKPGHILFPGRALCGETRLIDIGIAADVLDAIAPATFENVPALWCGAFPVPGSAAHKYSRGHAVICGGTRMTGAARLAARAAARVGAGLVTIASAPEAIPIYAADRAGQLTTALTARDDLAKYLSDPRRRAVLVGPGYGVGRRTREHARVALTLGKAVCLDADGLTSFADWPSGLFSALAEAGSLDGAAVLTPHEGEFRRLFPDLGEGGRLARARAAAARAGAVVVLKGADTVVAAPDGRAAINANAPPWLATAGSGDVLAGMITGFLAQGVAPFEAAAMAVWIHGAAAERFGPGLVADDLPDLIPRVLRALTASAASGTDT